MGDSRTPWFRLATDFWRNHKVANAGFLAGSLHLAGIAHSAEQLTDGFIPHGVVPILAAPMHGWVWVGEDGHRATASDIAASRPYVLADALCEVGLWEEVDGGYQILGYLDHQPSRAEVEKARSSQSEAGKRGAAKRWSKSSDSNDDGLPHGVPHGEGHGAPYGVSMGSGMADELATKDSAASGQIGADGVPYGVPHGEPHHEGGQMEDPMGSPMGSPMGFRWGLDGTCTYTSTDVSPNGDTSGGARTRARATRLPDEFTITDGMRAWAAEKVPGVDPDYETEKFCDYWRGVSGQRGTKRDWVGAWRNWLRKASENANRRRPQSGQAPPLSTADQRVLEAQRLKDNPPTDGGFGQLRVIEA